MNVKRKRYVIRVNPPDCAKCTRIIEKELSKIDDTRMVGADPLTGKIIIYIDPRKVSVEKLMDAVKKTGRTPYMIEER
ncbi:MAG: cation transporter [Thermoproteota archaeon]